MDYRNRIINKADLEAYLAGKDNLKVNRIFNKILSEMPLELRKEALDKGLQLKEIDRAMDLITFVIDVPHASEELKSMLASVDPFVICDEL